MAVSRLTQTTLQNGFEKFGRVWDGRSAVGSMEAISAITLTSAQSSIEFNNIPGTYSHLQINITLRGTSTGTGNESIYLVLNSNRGSNYTFHRLYGDGSTAESSAGTSQTSSFIGQYSRTGADNSAYFAGIVNILDYANTNKNKTLRTLNGWDSNGSGRIQLISSLWINTNAINSISILPEANNFAANSSFSLYGIR